MHDRRESDDIMANGHNDFDLDINGIVSELGKLRTSLGTNAEEFGFLANLLQGSQLQSLVKAHNTIMSSMTENKCQPVLSSAEDIAFEVMGEIQLKGLTEPDAVELFRLLQGPHMLNILSAHDMVAQKDFTPRLPDLPPDADDEEEETVKIVQLVKSNEPLRCTPQFRAELMPARARRSLSTPCRRSGRRHSSPLKAKPQHRLTSSPVKAPPSCPPQARPGHGSLPSTPVKAQSPPLRALPGSGSLSGSPLRSQPEHRNLSVSLDPTFVSSFDCIY